MAPSKKNTRNPDSPLFKRLTRLFSGPIINYRTQTGRRIRRQHLDKYSSRFKSASGQNFKKTGYNPFQDLGANLMTAQNRGQRYIDFDQMEYEPIIASARVSETLVGQPAPSGPKRKFPIHARPPTTADVANEAVVVFSSSNNPV